MSNLTLRQHLLFFAPKNAPPATCIVEHRGSQLQYTGNVTYLPEPTTVPEDLRVINNRTYGLKGWVVNGTTHQNIPSGFSVFDIRWISLARFLNCVGTCTPNNYYVQPMMQFKFQTFTGAPLKTILRWDYFANRTSEFIFSDGTNSFSTKLIPPQYTSVTFQVRTVLYSVSESSARTQVNGVWQYR